MICSELTDGGLGKLYLHFDNRFLNSFLIEYNLFVCNFPQICAYKFLRLNELILNMIANL